MQNLAGSWTEISSGEMVEIRKLKDQNDNYMFNFFLSKESFLVHADTKDQLSGYLTGLKRYLKSDPDERLHFAIEKGSNLVIKSSDKKLLATFRSNSED